MPEYVLGIDFGQKRIGLAVGQTLSYAANPTKVLPNNKDFFKLLSEEIKEWNISQIIIGLPLGMDGEEQEITRQVKNFSQKVQRHSQLPVHLVDERLSSYEAERRFAESRSAQMSKAKDKKNIDAFAAQIILQSWLDQQQLKSMP
ncbi:Holliday junction resolvase RuvX [Marinicella sp. S1101]|uniref:Holliday junction resolvase RuvX n=1 Tax=Marinicella marina TaxID=2996016 RepID=UPI002260FAE9|nr:Holliday junction resolvase RuvX [Marinicella marina]MCX7554604.1 Holliday junction resolvase RuvX [Marinicella marina]MDJ1141012.1 Holliday junction resolvase RuvX [Marinicella marina]